MAITVEMRTQVSELYVALFGRAPDGEGLGFWVGELDSGKSLTDVANTMYATAPARAYYPAFLTNGEIIESFYQNVLGRAADAEGLAFWTAKLNAAGATPGSVINEMITVVAKSNPADLSAEGVVSQNLFNNKVAVAQWYGEQNGTIAGATAILAGVTDDAATVEAAKAGGVVTSGETFTLTAGADMVDSSIALMNNGAVTLPYKPGSGNDLFRALISGDLDSADMLDGGAGTDTLSAVQTSATAGVTVKPTLKNIEIINFTVNSGDTASTTATLDLGDSTGVQEVWLKDALSANHAASTMGVTFSNVAAGVTVGINGGAKGSSGGVAANLTVGVKDAASNTADALTIKLADALANVVTAADIETITLSNSNTAASKSSTIDALTADKLKTLNIEGSGKLTVTALTGTGATLTNVNITGSGSNSITTATGTQTALKTIDASTATGNNTVAITGTAIANTSVKMGSGNDTVVFDNVGEITTAVGTEGAVSGGEGKDTIKIAGGAAFGATQNNDLKKATGFEVLEIAYAGATNTDSVTLDASAITGINEFVFSGATTGKTGASSGATSGATDGSAAVSVTGVENTDAFIFTANQIGAAGVSGATSDDAANGGSAAVFKAALDGGDDVLNITLKASASNDAAAIVLTGADGVVAAGTHETNESSGKAAIYAAEFEVVNLVSSGKSAATFTGENKLVGGASATGGTAGDAITINNNGKLIITGNKHLDLTSGVGGTNVTVDATDFTAILKVKTGAGNDKLIGGSGNDVLEGGAGVDTYTGNGGKNTFNIGSGEAGLTGNEKITDFKIGGVDTLNISTTTVIADIAEGSKVDVASAIVGGVGTDTLFATVSKGIINLSGNAVDKIDTVAEIKAIFELVDGTGATETGAIVMGGNTYVFVESGNSATADIIQLVGVTDATAVSTTAASGVILIA